MNFTLELSLERITLVRIAASFWGQPNIRAIIAKSGIPLNPYRKSKNWQDIEDRVIENVQQLPQPELLKQKILGFIKPIGQEILKWIKYHPRNCYSIDLPSDFHWTPQGTIDKQKTAEALMREEKLDVRIRYNLACIYCFEDHIQELWNKIPENHRNVVYITKSSMQQDLVFLWTKDLCQRVAATNKLTDCCFQNSKLDDCFQHSPASLEHAFLFATSYGNKAALEYFLPKLPLRSRELALVDAAEKTAVDATEKTAGRYTKYFTKNIDPCNEYCTEVLCFLLSHMNKEQQTEIFKSYAYGILKSFLDWPLQNSFIENASLLSEFLLESCYCDLLEQIIDKVTCGYKDYDYLNLYSEFRNRISKPNNGCVFQYGENALLEKLFHIKDVQFIKLVFHDVCDSRKKLLIFSGTGEDICKHLIYDGEWDLLKFCITECISSKHDMQDLITRLEKCLTKDEFKKMKGKWNKFFHLSDDLLCEFH